MATSKRSAFRLIAMTIVLTSATMLCMSTFESMVKRFDCSENTVNSFRLQFVDTEQLIIERSSDKDAGILQQGERNKRSAAVTVMSPHNESSANTKVPFKPFVKDQPKSVIVLAYQRTGSSFFGEMFNTNPDAFYMYEPLDAVYCALYGTSPGWNVPSDITSYFNGSQRLVPASEVDAIDAFLTSFYSCAVDRWPVQALTHVFWYKFNNPTSCDDYVACIRRHNLTTPSTAGCHSMPTRHCGMRFGEQSPARLDDCRRLVNDDKFRAAFQNLKVRQNFNNYVNCTAQIKQKVKDLCMPLLDTSCSRRRLRAVKTVRATMDSMEPLLQKLPNFRIVHLIRDPRAVALSRLMCSKTTRGQFSNKAGQDRLMASEALLYCRTVARDVRIRQQLETRYPGRIYSVLYDEVVANLHRYTKNVYRFLDEPLHAKTFAWVMNNVRQHNGMKIATRWQRVLTVYQNSEIIEACSELLGLLNLNVD